MNMRRSQAPSMTSTRMRNKKFFPEIKGKNMLFATYKQIKGVANTAARIINRNVSRIDMGFTIYLLLYNCNGTLLTTPPGFHPGFRDITFFLEFFLSHLPRDTHKILLDFCSSLQELYTFWIFSSPSFEKLSKGLAAELPAFAGSHCSASLAPPHS